MKGKRQGGGRAYHSLLEPHWDFIRELRQRRKTWKEIAALLLVEKGIRVTLHAPYLFYRRKLKRAHRTHWEDAASPLESPSAIPSIPLNRPDTRSAPLPAQPSFKRPNREQFNPNEFT